MKPSYKEYRCKNDGKLLFKGILVESEVEIKCKSCGEIITLKGEDGSDYMCMIKNCPGRIRMSDK